MDKYSIINLLDIIQQMDLKNIYKMLHQKQKNILSAQHLLDRFLKLKRYSNTKQFSTHKKTEINPEAYRTEMN